MMTTIDADLPCVHCGYALRGLDAGGSCPECGTPVARSRAGDRLAAADPAWLARVTLGQRLLAAAMIATTLGLCLGLVGSIVALMVASMLELEWLGRAAELIAQVIFPVGGLVALALATVGTVLVTSLDPRDTGRERPTAARPLARWAMATAAALLVLGEVGELGTGVLIDVLASAASFLGLAAFAVGLVAALRWLARLAARIPDPDLAASLAQHARGFRWLLPTILVLVLVARLASGPGWRGLDLVASVSSCTGGLLIIVLLVQLVGLTVTLHALARAFTAVRRTAADRTTDIPATRPEPPPPPPATTL